MKKIKILLGILFTAVIAGYAQNPIKYFRIDQIKTIKGEITDIKREKCFRNNNFIVIYLKEKRGDRYRVEVSPEWFFTMDLKVGSQIEVTGSYGKMNNDHVIMTQSITFQGEKYEFRDKYGFPLWRGKGKYMKQGYRGKGKRKRRGRH